MASSSVSGKLIPAAAHHWAYLRALRTWAARASSVFFTLGISGLLCGLRCLWARLLRSEDPRSGTPLGVLAGFKDVGSTGKLSLLHSWHQRAPVWVAMLVGAALTPSTPSGGSPALPAGRASASAGR